MSTSSNLLCCVCEKVFSTKGNLNKHEKKHQTDSIKVINNPTGVNFDEALFKCFEGCELSFKSSKNLRQHLILKHDFNFVEDQFDFERFEDFEMWLQNLEKNENLRFYKPRGNKRSASGDLETFVLMCSRSGKRRVISDDLRKRSEKSQGSSKHNFGCTSQILVTKEVISNKYSISYICTHYGHDQEIQHLRISKKSRKEVAQKLLIGVSATRVLDSTRDGITEVLNRDDILTRKDINNIKTSFNIDIGQGCRHHDDATSVCLWVEECVESNCNPILFFKKQGEQTIEWKFNKNDFCLIFMNLAQIEVFKKFGKNIICIDGTHGMNAYDFELTTVLVLDEFGESFPIAFLFSNRKDTYIYNVFFSYIKKAVKNEDENDYSCCVFMSDVTNVYFNAWMAIMGPPKKQLYCSWYIDRAWQQNLSKVADGEKRNWVYKTLKYLQTCLEIDVFEKEFRSFLSILQNEEVTASMYSYLKNNYFDNRTQWAYCYRRGCGINTNMHLESMHRVIKYVYLEGKRIKRLDKSIYALQLYLRDKTLDRIIKLTKGKCTKNLDMIKNKHRVAVASTFNWSVIEENVFQIQDEKNTKYIVKKIAFKNCCSLLCNYCKICVHCFECSCLDYAIRATICKHIHFINIHFQENGNVDNIGINNNSQEVREMVNCLALQPNVSKMTPHNLPQKIRFEVTQLQNNLNSLNYTTEEYEHILKHLKSLNKLGSVLPSQNEIAFNPLPNSKLIPSNAKIEKQFLYSTKKTSTRKNLKKPNSLETNIIKDTLSQSLFVSDTPQNDHLY